MNDVTLNVIEPPRAPSSLARYEVRVGGRTYLTVRCTSSQAARIARQLRKDAAYPAVARQLSNGGQP